MAANPTLASLLSELRIRSAEPNASGRWNDVKLTALINRASVDIGLVLEWPEASWYFVAQAPPVGSNNAEYYLDEHTNILRVKLGGPPGQNIVPTSIDMLEGTDYGLFDQGSSTTPFTASWQSQVPGTYPIQSNTGGPAALTLPWSPGSRPAFYLRGNGAVIGFVPSPAVGTLVQIDCISAPPLLANPTDMWCFPYKAVDALVYRVRYYMADADDNNEQMLRMEMAYAGQNGTGGALGRLLTWKAGTPKHKSRAPLFTTARTRFSGPPRVGSGRGRLGS